MAGNTLTLEDVSNPDDFARQVVGMWDSHAQQRLNLIHRWDEIRNYIYATDSDTTSGPTTPWKNRTTRPKLTFIFDKMKTTYIRKLIPTDEFFRWKGSPHSKYKLIAKAIQHLMVHKMRHPYVKFREVMAQCLADFLLFGNCFAGVEYIFRYQRSIKDGAQILVFKGARPYRISPWDSDIEPLAPDYESSPYMRQEYMPRAKFYSMIEANPAMFDAVTIDKMRMAHGGAYAGTDVIEAIKNKNRTIDGVSLYDHWSSGQVNIKEYFGPIKVQDQEAYQDNQHVMVVDNLWTAIKRNNDTYLGIKPVVHAGFRKKPDNLWSMGPLDNLIGMQYRVDHLENAKSDALDLCVYPIRLITGDSTAESYPIQPGAEWYVPPNGKVQLLYPDPRILMFENDIMSKEQEMEEFAAVPRETAGFRTPGEKTGFEVQQLLEHADQLPDEKIAEFESQFVEPLLNLMLEQTLRHLDEWDLKSMLPEDAELWQQIQLDDLKQDGRLYPIGSKQAKERTMKIANVTQILELGTKLAPEHTAKFRAMQMLAEEAGVDEEGIVGFGAGLEESVALQQKQQQLEEQFTRDNPNAEGTPFDSMQRSQEAAM